MSFSLIRISKCLESIHIRIRRFSRYTYKPDNESIGILTGSNVRTSVYTRKIKDVVAPSCEADLKGMVKLFLKLMLDSNNTTYLDQGVYVNKSNISVVNGRQVLKAVSHKKWTRKVKNTTDDKRVNSTTNTKKLWKRVWVRSSQPRHTTSPLREVVDQSFGLENSVCRVWNRTSLTNTLPTGTTDSAPIPTISVNKNISTSSGHRVWKHTSISIPTSTNQSYSSIIKSTNVSDSTANSTIISEEGRKVYVRKIHSTVDIKEPTKENIKIWYSKLGSRKAYTQCEPTISLTLSAEVCDNITSSTTTTTTTTTTTSINHEQSDVKKSYEQGLLFQSSESSFVYKWNQISNTMVVAPKIKHTHIPEDSRINYRVWNTIPSINLTTTNTTSRNTNVTNRNQSNPRWHVRPYMKKQISHKNHMGDKSTEMMTAEVHVHSEDMDMITSHRYDDYTYYIMSSTDYLIQELSSQLPQLQPPPQKQQKETQLEDDWIYNNDNIYSSYSSNSNINDYYMCNENYQKDVLSHVSDEEFVRRKKLHSIDNIVTIYSSEQIIVPKRYYCSSTTNYFNMNTNDKNNDNTNDSSSSDCNNNNNNSHLLKDTTVSTIEDSVSGNPFLDRFIKTYSNTNENTSMSSSSNDTLFPPISMNNTVNPNESNDELTIQYIDFSIKDGFSLTSDPDANKLTTKQEVTSSVVYTAEDLILMTLTDIQLVLISLNLSSDGSKEELIDRYIAYQSFNGAKNKYGNTSDSSNNSLLLSRRLRTRTNKRS